nr:hypothetical protein OHB51_13610 [Micromonospora sp. NBC_00855]
MSQTGEWNRVVEGVRVQFMAGQHDEPATAVIIPRPGVEAMVAALGEMIRVGDLDVMLSMVEDGAI